MAVDAVLGNGTRFYYGTDGSTWTELANVVDIPTRDGRSADQVELPVLYGTAAMEFANGQEREGKAVIRSYWKKTMYDTFRGYVGTSKYFKVTYPDTSTDVFQANIERAAPEGISKNVPIYLKIDIQISGDVTFTAAV